MTGEIGLGLESLFTLMGYCLLQHLGVQRTAKRQAVLREVEVNVLRYRERHLTAVVGFNILEDDFLAMAHNLAH